jgi:hypothetical protein
MDKPTVKVNKFEMMPNQIRRERNLIEQEDVGDIE